MISPNSSSTNNYQNTMKKRPFNDHDIHLRGFTPLVEDCADGSILRALPEQKIVLPGETTRRSILALGLPGSGKSKRLVERCVSAVLSNPEPSVVVFAVQSASSNQAKAAARHFRGSSAVIEEFNPGDASKSTVGCNMIADVKTKSDARDVSDLICLNSEERTQNGADSYFNNDSRDKLTQIILALQQVRSGRASMADLKDTIDGGGQDIADLAVRSGNARLKRWADELIGDSRNAQTTLTMMSGLLGAWDDDDVRETTSRDELDFDELLLRRSGLLMVSVDEEKVSKLAPVTSLLFRKLFAWIMSTSRNHGGALPRHLFIFIDELPAAGRIPELGKRLTATFRKSNVSVIAAAQSEAQIQAVYQEETPSVLAGFASRIYVPPLSHMDAEAVSARTGIIETCRTVTDADGRILSSNPAPRPLLLPGELSSPRHPQLGPRILFQLADVPPFLGYLRGAWELEGERVIQEKASKNIVLKRKARRTKQPSHDRVPENPGMKSQKADFSSTAGWSRQAILERLERVKVAIGYDASSFMARDYWDAFEIKNDQRPDSMLQLAEAIEQRGASIEDFYAAWLYSNADDILAILHFMDYMKRVHINDGLGAFD
jgi:hypothetical protein